MKFTREKGKRKNSREVQSRFEKIIFATKILCQSKGRRTENGDRILREDREKVNTKNCIFDLKKKKKKKKKGGEKIRRRAHEARLQSTRPPLRDRFSFQNISQREAASRP